MILVKLSKTIALMVAIIIVTVIRANSFGWSSQEILDALLGILVISSLAGLFALSFVSIWQVVTGKGDDE